MILTDKALQDFNKQKPWYFWLLPEKYRNLIIYRWFLNDEKFWINLWCRDNGYDYGVEHPNSAINKVYVGVGKGIEDFDENIRRAITVANILYNDRSIVEIPRIFF